MNFSEAISLEIVNRARDTIYINSNSEFLEAHQGKVFVIETHPGSATTIWIDGPMARIYVKYLGKCREKDTPQHI